LARLFKNTAAVSNASVQPSGAQSDSLPVSKAPDEPRATDVWLHDSSNVSQMVSVLISLKSRMHRIGQNVHIAMPIND
jgi:hypothetical protein